MLTRSIISVIQSQFHQLHVLCSTMEPKNSESSIRRMQNFGNLVIMRRSRFFFPKGGVGVGPRDSLICQERGVWGSEVFHRPLYHFEFTRGGGRVRTYIEPPSRYAHINYRQFEKAIFWIPFFFLVFFRRIVQEATINDRVEAPSRQTRSEIVLSLFAILFILEDKITLCL